MQPTLSRQRLAMLKDAATVEPFPVQQDVKGILRRTIQLLKRHRDYYFQNTTAETAPISVIITTLAMRSYQYCVQGLVFDDELDVLVETIRNLPYFIDRQEINGKQIYAIWNETTQGENFAERWNTEPARVAAFYQWQTRALADFEAIRDAVGIDRIANKMQDALGESAVKKVLGMRTQAISAARTNGLLGVSPNVGLSMTTRAGATRVPKNDFFGD